MGSFKQPTNGLVQCSCHFDQYWLMLNDLLFFRLWKLTFNSWSVQTFCSIAIIYVLDKSWWHHQMETFSTLLILCAGNSPVTSEFPTQRLVTQSFEVFFDACLNKRLSSKQSWGWWFEMPLCSLWHHYDCNVACIASYHLLNGTCVKWNKIWRVYF